MKSARWISLAAAGSAGLLLGAFAFQYIGGLAPCEMCIWQRYPHALAVFAGLAAMIVSTKLWAVLGGLSMLTAFALGAYHAAVEQGWLEGPATCSAGSVGALNAEDLFDQIMSAPLIRCDEIVWSFAGLSMAGWNAVLSLILTLIWIRAFRAKPF